MADLIRRAFASVQKTDVIKRYKGEGIGLLVEVMPGPEPYLRIGWTSGGVIGILNKQEMHKLAGLIYSALGRYKKK